MLSMLSETEHHEVRWAIEISGMFREREAFLQFFAENLPTIVTSLCVCVCVYYQIAHDGAIRPCHPSHSMPLALILPSVRV